MLMQTSKDLYQQVVDITSDYLGPASRRFIDRQIINHLDKQPEEITDKDLNSLIDWIRVAIALLTEDKKLISEFTDRLKSLTNKRFVA
jgi:hypothetical protein